MAANKVIYGGETLVDLTMDSVTPDKLAAGVTAHDKSGNKITGTMSANFKAYEITLAKASGWILLTTLDAEVLAHINDASLVVSLVNIDPYVYDWYAGRMYIAGNTPIGYNGDYPAYGMTSRIANETYVANVPTYYPANNTGTNTNLGGNGTFRVSGEKYYLQPGDGFISAGTYRLTLTW